MAKRAWRYFEPKFLADRVCEMHPVWPWGGHRRFAYDLVRWMRPKRIGELGVHWGTSFFAFAQAMKDGRMRDTELIGVDTFEGEEHAGTYGPEVLETVRQIVADHFPKQKITLHKMLFSEALPLVEDESLDLLHIDGLHTYEAVREDFETWLPKLAPEGVVLFHDVAPDTGYGSTDYWNEISARHPGFAFEHSWGLGVLFPKGEARLAELRRQALEDKLIAYPALARAERLSIEVRDVGRMAKERLETIRKQGEANAELRESMQRLRESTAPREQLEKALHRAEAAEKMARERYEVIRSQSENVAARDRRIESLEADLERSRTLVRERGDALKQAAERAGRAQHQLTEARARAQAAEAARDELRGRIEDLRGRVDDLRARVEAQARAVEAAETERRETGKRLERALHEGAEAREQLAATRTAEAHLRRDLEAAAKARERLDAALGDMATHVAALAGSHEKDRLAHAERLDALARALAEARRAGEDAAAAARDRLDSLDVDAELQSVRAEHLERIVEEHRERFRRLASEGRGAEEDWLTGQRLG